MVYGTIRQLGGAVSLQSQPGQGCVARVWLPAGPPGRLESSTPPSDSPAITGLTGTVLVVDDEEAILEISQRLLSATGLKVLTARDGAEALRICKAEGGVGLVMLDMIMPVMDGAATFDQLAKRWPEVPVLLCTGFADQTKADRLLSRGAVGLLLKPFDREGLLQAVARALFSREGQ